MTRDGDHSSRPVVAEWLKRPTRRSFPDESGIGRATLLTPPYLVLHCEEFAWPRMSPRAPVRSYIKSRGTAPFHPSPRQVGAGLFSVALVVDLRDLKFESEILTGRPAVSGLAAL